MKFNNLLVAAGLMLCSSLALAQSGNSGNSGNSSNAGNNIDNVVFTVTENLAATVSVSAEVARALAAILNNSGLGSASSTGGGGGSSPGQMSAAVRQAVANAILAIKAELVRSGGERAGPVADGLQDIVDDLQGSP